MVLQSGSSADPTVLGAVRHNGPLYFKDIEIQNYGNYMAWLTNLGRGYVAPDKAKAERRQYLRQRRHRVLDLTRYRPNA